MTPHQLLKADVARFSTAIARLKKDGEVEREMLKADLRRAERALLDYLEAGELGVLRGIVRGTVAEAV